MGLDLYTDYMKTCERRLWEKFDGVRRWQDGLGKEYRRLGYIETFVGFRYGGLLTRNDLYNYKIQGTAFHLLLWCLIQANRERKRRGWASRLILQIHDSMIWDLVPEEQKEVVEVCWDIMVNKAPEHFEWINTPLEAEPEITEIDGSFYDLKKLGEDEDGYQQAA
jgi:DNA polymerase I-like protein with 3'-5' exonuclease and polymerase domains